MSKLFAGPVKDCALSLISSVVEMQVRWRLVLNTLSRRWCFRMRESVRAPHSVMAVCRAGRIRSRYVQIYFQSLCELA